MTRLALLLVLLASPVAAQIAPGCAQYQWTITREVQKRAGPAAPVSTYAAQLMQESSCKSDAASYVGAQGLAQFMPATAKWMATLDSALAPPDPMNANWAIRAQIVYMMWLMKRNAGASECDVYAFGLSSYNGGEGWLRRDMAVCRAKVGCDAMRWFGHVEYAPTTRRAPWAIKENRGYPRRILSLLTPRFVAAGWGRGVVCKVGG